MTKNEMFELYRELVIGDIMDEMWLENIADTEAFEMQMDAFFADLEIK